MKKSFLKIGFMFALAMITTVSLNSCSGGDDAEGDATEQTDGDEQDADKCEDGKCEEGKCEEGKCEDGKCEEGKCEEAKCEAGEGKQAGKNNTPTTVDTQVPEPKPAKQSTRGGDSPKMTTDGSN